MKALLKIALGILVIGAAFAAGLTFERKIEEAKTDSQWKAIIGNLRQFSSAGQQYLMEYGGESVSYQTLLEKEYFPDLWSVAGETYSDLIFSKNKDAVYVQIPNSAYYVLYHY